LYSRHEDRRCMQFINLSRDRGRERARREIRREILPNVAAAGIPALHSATTPRTRQRQLWPLVFEHSVGNVPCAMSEESESDPVMETKIDVDR
jgi:hypothetical protein